MLLDNPVSNPTTESNIDIILQEEEGNRRENNVQVCATYIIFNIDISYWLEIKIFKFNYMLLFQDPECTGLPVVTLWQNDFDSVLLPVPGVEIEFITANFTNTSLAGNLTTEINGTGLEKHDTDPIESVQLLPADETSLEVTRKNANIVASTSHDILQGEENISEEEMLVHQNADTDSDFAPKPPDSPQKGCDPRPKRGRKRKHETSREENKAKRNRNEEHYNNKGVKVVKSFKDYRCNCSQMCHERLSVEVRKEQYIKYWELGSYDAQTNFIAAHVSENTKKRSQGKNEAKRCFSRRYRFGSENVCRDIFVITLGISTKRVNTALKKLRTSSITDKRGHTQGGKNKISDGKKQEVVRQISKIPKYKSHYRREQTGAKFLPPGMTLQDMYGAYKTEVSEPVSYSTYRRIFLNDFNLRFKALKKDTCNSCDTYAAKLQTPYSEEETLKIKQDHDKHIDIAEEAQKLMRTNMKDAKDQPAMECLTFDMEKTLPLPRIPTNVMFYKRQLWLYNCGIHSGKYSKGLCYVWVEGQAGRGAQEVGSCLLHHIENKIEKDTKTLILWSDSCGGQNRNIKLTLILKAALESHPSLTKIHLRFLVSGHSFLPNDADFSDIETALKHQQRLYLPEDYKEVMKTCRKRNPLEVVEMKKFIGTSQLEQMVSNRKIDVNKEKVSWLQTREIMLEKNKPFSIFLRKDFVSEYSEIDIKKRQSGRPLTGFRDKLIPLWENGKPIAIPKLRDIESVMDLIPGDAKEFYKALFGAAQVEDDVDGFSGAPDFDVE
ncbi:uncharacterized protein LOC134546186 isoform X3 [Bacillus rossius redtenbacheri]